MTDLDEIRRALLSQPPMSAIVAMLDRPFDSSQQTKAEFTAEAVGAGFDLAASALEAGVDASQMHVRATICPKCGCPDVDLDATDIEADKLVCFQCGEVYTMKFGNSIPVDEADFR